VTIEVVEHGALTSVQDSIGRPGWRHLGVPAGGAADPWSATLANRLVRNEDDAAVLEITIIGPTLRILVPTVVALVGRFAATVDGLALPAEAGRSVRAGSLLRIEGGDDARGYVAAAGGIDVEPVLGSASTDLRSGFGGVEGRALRAGDLLRIGPAPGARPARWLGTRPSGPIRVVAGPHADRFPADALTSGTWRIGTLADRAGARLEGGAPLSTDGREVPSMGLPAGAVQVPPDGSPIVTLADRPVTGGYPVPAVVIGADVGRVARLRTGDELRFASVTLDAALDARRDAAAALDALEPIGDDDDTAWAGAHG
jgi:biotin-dependent carboxylase-like uncharacterized protein